MRMAPVVVEHQMYGRSVRTNLFLSARARRENCSPLMRARARQSTRRRQTALFCSISIVCTLCVLQAHIHNTRIAMINIRRVSLFRLNALSLIRYPAFGRRAMRVRLCVIKCVRLLIMEMAMQCYVNEHRVA